MGLCRLYLADGRRFLRHGIFGRQILFMCSRTGLAGPWIGSFGIDAVSDDPRVNSVQGSPAPLLPTSCQFKGMIPVLCSFYFIHSEVIYFYLISNIFSHILHGIRKNLEEWQKS